MLAPIRTLAALVFAAGAVAHEIPADVTIQAFVRPSGQRLDVLLRLPLTTMRDSEFPETAEGNLDIEKSGKALRDAVTVWIARNVAIYEDGAALPAPTIDSVRVALPSDKAFASFAEAQAHLAAPQQNFHLVWSQAMLDVALSTPISNAGARFAVQSGLARLGVRTATVVRYLAPGTPERVFEWEGDPGRVELDPSWAQAFMRFVRTGFGHILEGTDHLLFLACLVIPLRRLWTLVPVVTAFTVAHSVTLAASAYGMAPDALWFPPLIETLIAASIVYMAIENIVAALDPSRATLVNRRWMMAFGFGLIHGFGFSFALRQTLQFAGDHVVTSLAAFNIGVELGQLAVLIVLVPVLNLLFTRALPERIGQVIASALLADTGWHWLRERGATLAAYRFEAPSAGPSFWAFWFSAAFWVSIAAAVVWAVRPLVSRMARRVG